MNAWYILAYMVLTAPGDPEIPPYLAAAEPFREAVRSLALDWEIMDSRERRWIMKFPEDCTSNLQLLRGRYQDMADAPPVSDAGRFPDRTYLNDVLAFNREYRAHLVGIWTPGQADAIGETIATVDRLYAVWDNVRDAQCDYYYVSMRRKALKNVREAIGDEAYYRGELPCYVPLGQFRPIDDH